MSRGRLVFAVGLFVLLVGANLELTPWYERSFKSQDAAPTPVSALLDVLGEVRTFMARRIYFQIDLYHHEMEAQGIMWTKEWDLMAYYRMITALDPRFVEAYDVASYQLVMNFHKPKEGIEYLQDGLRHNPDSVILNFDMAFLEYRLKHYQRAMRAAQHTVQLTLPHFGEDEFAFLNSVRILAHAARSAHDRATEIDALKIWLRVRPKDAYAIRRMKALGLPPRGYSKAQFPLPELSPAPSP